MCDTKSKEKTNGTRLRRLLLDGGTKVLRDLLDSYHSASGALTAVLKNYEPCLKKKCFPDQINLLFPSNGQPADSETFDITLLTLLLSTICVGRLTPPKSTGSWTKEPLPSDKSKEANIVRIRLFRNKIQHVPSSGISDSEFKRLWNELSAPLIDLGLPGDEIKNIKTSPIDDDSEIQERFEKLCDHEKRIEKLEDDVKELKEELQTRKIQTLRSCIPDEPSSFIGRAKELEEIIHAKTVEKKPFVLIHGMAGIGKSTLIKKASWDLDKQHENIVYFVDLCRCEASEESIAKTINYKLHYGTKIDKEPREALNNWARNLQQDVILVLDNAEDVLSHQQTANGMCFEKILKELREFSNQRLNYLIASREALNLDDIPKKEIGLNPFEERDSLKFIDLHSEEYNSELTDGEKQAFVKLCSNIPLALRIVIPLLEDYSPDELIDKLKSKPMEDILEPLKRALFLSFEKLDSTLREYFVRLTIFSASFSADSAKAVIGQNAKKDTVQVLKTLSRKSLVQNENRKYNLHPFIHEFVVDYGMKNAKEQLQKGKINFFKHFVSRILEYTDLFWAKDCCNKSLMNFFEERIHHEKALEMSHNGSLTPDEVKTVWNNTDTVDKLTDVVGYLESCISWDLLERLLTGFINLTRDSKLQSRELELICWKGHIARRKGNHESYEKSVLEADEIYSKDLEVLDDRALVCYKTAKGRHLGHKGKREEAIEIFKEVVQICHEKAKDDPVMNKDYARALVELGHNLKHRKEYNLAQEKYKHALGIYEKYLGEHIHTAICFKDLADGYMIQDNSSDFFNTEALKHYVKALDMLNKVNSVPGSQTILPLKNIGVCCRNLKRYEDSKKYLMEARTIAEKNIKDDHKYKCWVTQELAFLYYDMGKMEQAKACGKDAKEMANKLNLKHGDWLRNDQYKEKMETILGYSLE